MRDSERATRMVAFYGAPAATVASSDAPAWSSGKFVVYGCVTSANGGLSSEKAILAWNGSTYLDMTAFVAPMGLNLVFDTNTSDITLTGSSGTVPNATIIGYWLP